MESLVLNRINFQLSVATCKAFLSPPQSRHRQR